MNSKIHDKFREAVAKNIELWDTIRDLEQLLLDEVDNPELLDIDGLDETVRDVACGHDCRESAQTISAEAIEDVIRGLLPEDEAEGGEAQ